MKITHLADEPLVRIPYASVRDGGSGASAAKLPVLVGAVEGLPPGLDALVLTADLQGMEMRNGKPTDRFLGQVVAEEVAALCELGEWDGAKLPPPDRVGVLLAGDLFAHPDLHKRGGMGEVGGVWEAFHPPFRWVVGVMGNHDGLAAPFPRHSALHLLEAGSCSPDQLAIAGLGGIVGNPRKSQRHDEEHVRRTIQNLARSSPEILLLHEGPELPDRGARGHAAVATALRSARDLLVVCGHKRAEHPLVQLPAGVQLLNVHERVVILVRPALVGGSPADGASILAELERLVRAQEPALESSPFAVVRTFERNGRPLHLGLTLRLKERCRRVRVWLSRPFLSTLKNASYGFDSDRPRSSGGVDGIYRVDRDHRPSNAMMDKLFARYLDREDSGVREVAGALGASVATLTAVRLVSHHMRLLGVLHRGADADWLVLVDQDSDESR